MNGDKMILLQIIFYVHAQYSALLVQNHTRLIIIYKPQTFLITYDHVSVGKYYKNHFTTNKNLLGQNLELK